MKSPKTAKAPQRRNADATRAKILQAALTEFSERGLPAASTDDIAERCGVNKRMIYYYFGSKEGLYLAALESVYEKLVALEQEIEIDHLDPPTAIEAIINLKIDYYVANPEFISFLSMENFYKARHLRKSKKLDMFKSPLDRRHCAHSRARPAQRAIQTRCRAGELLRFDLRTVHHVFHQPAHARRDLWTEDDTGRQHPKTQANGHRHRAQLFADAGRHSDTDAAAPT